MWVVGHVGKNMGAGFGGGGAGMGVVCVGVGCSSVVDCVTSGGRWGGRASSYESGECGCGTGRWGLCGRRSGVAVGWLGRGDRDRGGGRWEVPVAASQVLGRDAFSGMERTAGVGDKVGAKWCRDWSHGGVGRLVGSVWE